MPLTTNQQTQMTELKTQLTKLEAEVMNSPQCTMGGMGNYLFDAFKKLKAQAEKVEKA